MILRSSLLILALALIVSPAQAEEFGGVEFPDGIRSFADVVADFSPAIVNGQPTTPYLDSSNAIGAPDFTGATSCGGTCTFTSLGDGGSITLRFTDNVLTGSGNADLDLWIFEIGPDVEDTFVEVSVDGVAWTSVGKVFGSTSGVDLDAFGFGPGDAFSWVRLTDDPNEGANSGNTVGADIDAVGAISSTAGCDVSAVTPDFPWSAGDTVVITGDGFMGDSVPKINGVTASPYTVDSAQQITATVPALADGSYVLTVELSNGQACELVGRVVATESMGWGPLKSRFE